jgi:ribosomal protein S18 acetylase RimI-like enzyme
MSQSCSHCENSAQYLDQQTGQPLCLEHSRLAVIAVKRPPHRRGAASLAIRSAVVTDYARIEEISQYFWGETDVDCLDRQYHVLACPAYLACDGDNVVGLVSYVEEVCWQALVLVIFNVLPEYQGCGGGRALLDAVREEALRRGLARMIVCTSNDNLPALGFYQRYGFRFAGIVPDRIADDHGGAFRGLAGIMVRDEIRLVYDLHQP